MHMKINSVLTCACIRPFSVTIQCVDAEIPTIISKSKNKILQFFNLTIFHVSILRMSMSIGPSVQRM